jgi:microcystin-dependent protein
MGREMSQGSLVNPTSGTLSGLSLVDNLNLAFDALVTMNSGAAAPANAASPHPAGQLWLNTSVSPWLVQISDATDWLTIGYLDATNHIYTPKGATGVGADWWGPAASIPPGSLLAYGQVLLIASYPALGALFGTTYGGDGVTTFGMPDLRGRATAGVDNMGGTAANRLTSGGSGIVGSTLGASGGAETHALTSGENGTHGHALTDGGHSHTVNDPGHLHGPGGHSSFLVGDAADTAIPGAGGRYSLIYLSSTTAWATTGITNNSATTGITLANSGSGTAHQNCQPSIVCNKIIWT